MMRRLAPVLALLAACSDPPEPSPLDRIVPPILESDRIPGAVIVVGTKDSVTYRKAFGAARLDTVFDLASCTKVVGTTTAAMKLIEEGRLSLDHPVGRSLPVFGARDITVRELLVHRSGLPPYLTPKSRGSGRVLAEISRLERPKKYAYS